MKSFLPFLVFFLFDINMNAQNLVQNGSFEELTSCPQLWGQIDSCLGWFPEANSPDCLAECSPYPISIPNNYLGNQFPYEGNSYAGFYSFVSSSGNYRETLAAKLIEPLIIGNTYHFSMRVCRAYNYNNNVIIANNHIGAKFSKFLHEGDNAFSSDNYQQLDEDSIITDSINWVLLTWKYTPDSSYNYIYIGNFYDDAHTNTINSVDPNTYAYYYLDSVNLYCVNGTCTSDISNDHNDEAVMQYSEKSYFLSLHNNTPGDIEFLLINVWGEKILQMTIFEHTDISLSYLPNGFYIAWIIKGNRSWVKKISIY